MILNNNHCIILFTFKLLTLSLYAFVVIKIRDDTHSAKNVLKLIVNLILSVKIIFEKKNII